MKIYEIHNPLFLSDIFVFGEIEGIGKCYIKVNYHNKIERRKPWSNKCLLFIN